MNKDKVFVTKTFLPPLEEYINNLNRAWNKRWITNQGELAQELENKLKEYLGVKHVLFVSNGTIAIQFAIKALNLKKSIITTPFTFVATTSAILWEKCSPIFVDIDPKTFSIDTNKIEQAITKDTEAILAVHVYGYPCNVEAIEKIAKKHNLKVIYDAAHAFGVKMDGKSILEFGDISVLSLHATKLFHTGEGGLIVTNNDELAKKINLLRDFGLKGESPIELGINGKNSELHAALGLTNLNYIDSIVEKRKIITEAYSKLLKISRPYLDNNVEHNYSYYPIIFKNEEELLKVKRALEENNIYPRRYFYPSLNNLPFVENTSCPNAEEIAKRVLCLPLYHDLPIETAEEIAAIIIKTLEESKPTLAIGIPAHNEGGNIINLINSIISQRQNTYVLKEIIVNSDSSTDNTIPLIKALAIEDKRIRLIENDLRKGKPYRLNELYLAHDSDFILTLDADVLLKDNNVIEEMLNIFIKDNQAVAVAGHLTPTKPKSFIGKIMYTNNILWNLIRTNINNGDHIANLYGGTTMLKNDFSKSFSYPTNISCDEEFLYVKAKEKNGFRYAKNAVVLFRPPENIKEVVLQGRRALKERDSLVQYFGENILELHDIPIKYKIYGIMKMMFTEPIYTTLSLLFNFFIKIFPYKDESNKEGMWKIAYSTKKLIKA